MTLHLCNVDSISDVIPLVLLSVSSHSSECFHSLLPKFSVMDTLH